MVFQAASSSLRRFYGQEGTRSPIWAAIQQRLDADSRAIALWDCFPPGGAKLVMVVAVVVERKWARGALARATLTVPPEKR